MSNSPAPLHVYARQIHEDERTSLSVLASMVRPGAQVLDLGCGSGALGEHLRQTRQCVLDGVTINDAEAALARAHYEQLEVADLDQCDLLALFPARRYDHIICADVLEHLKQPERVLKACETLLADGGELLISIPNAGYAGLIAELLQGKFTYRSEGLLDRTHLRFFTRQSLLQLLGDHGWGVQSLQTIARALPESEFRADFDALPPLVARYLLAVPDGQTYQFVVSARHGQPHAAELPALPTNAQALFTACVYLADSQGYDEHRKVEACGVIGQLRQTLRFPLPATPATRLRLDPADRPGFLHLHGITLRNAQGEPLWRWRQETDSLASLEHSPHHGILLRGPGPGGASALALLHTDDPWLELPIPPQSAAQAGHGTLEVELGWPMSADYMALTETARQASREHQIALGQLSHTLQAHQQQLTELQRKLEAQSVEDHALREHNQTLLQQKARLLREQQALEQRGQMLQDQQQQLQSELGRLQHHLRWLENSTVFRASRPLVRLKMWWDGHRSPLEPSAPPPALQGPSGAPQAAAGPRPVDVIVPVYRGLADTRRCIESVLAHPQQTPWQLVVINDCSPEPEVTAWLRDKAAQEPRITLLENTENLGFVATVNRGMALNPTRDVLLLNSDTEVANQWLDRLARAAHQHGRVGTVTPFSNNATLCSYPRFCEANELPPGYDTARLDALFARTRAGQVVDVPTGVGFCMYIRRDCLDEVGLFDVEHFGKGYGEENDFCQRALRSGWRNLHALDTFVLHTGGVSFGDSKNARERAAMETLRRLHPDYERSVHDFLAQDPARSARLAVDLARVAESALPVVLAVMHNRAGGTVRHAQELAQHLTPRAVFFMLRPQTGDRVLLERVGPHEAFALSFKLPHEHDALLHALRHIGVRHIHYHHLLGHQAIITELAQQLGVSFDFTAHDYYSFCPQISLTDHTDAYCGEQGLEQCRQCLRRAPAPGGGTIEVWRDYHRRFLQHARHILVPSRDAARRMARHFPGTDVRLAPHTDLVAAPPAPQPHRLEPHAPLKVVVIGALSAIKGADVLEDVATQAARRGVAVEFHLIGYGYRALRTQPRARLTVHGAYEDADLPDILQWLQPDLAWFPAQWPETYSYTLSACLQAGLPVVAPDLGAFSERLQGRPWSWVLPWNTSSPQWVDFFERVRQDHFVHHLPATAPAAPAGDPMDARIGSWCYQTDYLEGLSAAPPLPVLDDAFLQAHQPGRTAGLEAAQQEARHGALQLLMRLRAAPGLRNLARLVPLPWQRRVKSWLMR